MHRYDLCVGMSINFFFSPQVKLFRDTLTQKVTLVELALKLDSRRQGCL